VYTNIRNEIIFRTKIFLSPPNPNSFQRFPITRIPSEQRHGYVIHWTRADIVEKYARVRVFRDTRTVVVVTRGIFDGKRPDEIRRVSCTRYVFYRTRGSLFLPALPNGGHTM